MLRATVLLGLLLALMGGAARAAEDLLDRPLPSAYFDYRFGAESRTDDGLHLGLALRAAHAPVAAPPLAQMDFTPRGAMVAKLGGVPLLVRDPRLQQAEGETAPVEAEGEQGLLSQAGDFFAGLGIGTGALLLAGTVAGYLILSDSDNFRPMSSPNNPDDDDDGGGILPFPNPIPCPLPLCEQQ